MNPLPATLAANPQLDRWLRVEADGTITVRSGKVEIGQGIATAIAAIAARELGVEIDCLRIVSGDTRTGPDEGLTTDSQSVEAGGAAMRRAAALVRTLFAAAAARVLDVPEDAIEVADGVFTARGRNQACSYWDLREVVDLAVSAADLPAPVERGGSADSAELRRIDLRGKLSGGAFIQDMRLPGMLHGRVIRGRNPAARPVGADLSAIATMPGVVSVVVDGDLLGVVARREDQARQAAAKARVTWQAQPLPADTEGLDWMDPGSADTRVLIDEPGAAAAGHAGAQLRAAVPGTRRHRPVLRGGVVAGRAADRVVAQPGRVQPAPPACAGSAPRGRRGRCRALTRRRLLRP